MSSWREGGIARRVLCAWALVVGIAVLGCTSCNAQFLGRPGGLFSRRNFAPRTDEAPAPQSPRPSWFRVATRSGNPPNTAMWERRTQGRVAAEVNPGSAYMSLSGRQYIGGDTLACPGAEGACVLPDGASLADAMVRCNAMPECKGFEVDRSGGARAVITLKGGDPDTRWPAADDVSVLVKVGAKDDGDPLVARVCPCRDPFGADGSPESIRVMLETCLAKDEFDCAVVRAEPIVQAAAGRGIARP